MIIRYALSLLPLLLPLARADFKITSPSAGDSITGLTLDIEWEDTNDKPELADIATYQMFLMAGSDDAAGAGQLATLVQNGDPSDGELTTSVTLTAGLGANVKNAYYIKVIAAATGGQVINFSDRFSLPSMTGVFAANIVTGLKTVSGNKGPDTINQITTPQNAPAAAAPVGGTLYDVPYSMQSDSIRYAPMPPQAPTSITAKNAKSQYPTSAYNPYVKAAGAPNAITTNTMPVTVKVESREPTFIAAAGQPSDAAMQKFLERWKD